MNPGRNYMFWHIGSTTLYQGNPGRNHKFWRINSPLWRESWYEPQVLADQQLSIKGILVGTTSSGGSTALYQRNPGTNHEFWHIGSTAFYQGNPGGNHKFCHIGSTALYQGNPGRNHKFWHIWSTAIYQGNPGRNHKFWRINIPLSRESW